MKLNSTSATFIYWRVTCYMCFIFLSEKLQKYQNWSLITRNKACSKIHLGRKDKNFQLSLWTIFLIFDKVLDIAEIRCVSLIWYAWNWKKKRYQTISNNTSIIVELAFKEMFRSNSCHGKETDRLKESSIAMWCCKFWSLGTS